MSIREFSGEFRFLSNYFNANVRLNGITFPTNEHAFAAFKTTDITLRSKISAATTPGEAKRVGRQLALRPDWEGIKSDVMRAIVHAKFRQNPELAARLLLTGSRELIEGNTWGDRVWGIDLKTGTGENRLGMILMDERREVQSRVLAAADSFSQVGPTPHNLADADLAGHEAFLHGFATILGGEVAIRYFVESGVAAQTLLVDDPPAPAGPTVIRTNAAIL